MTNLNKIEISSLPLTNEKLHAVDGSLLTATDYSEFVAFIAQYYSDNPPTQETFVQPALNANGTLGGNSFAVYANTEFTDGNYPIWKAFDGNTTTGWATNGNPNPSNVIFYNPQALNVTLLTMTNRGNTENITGGTVYGSNDNSTWTSLTTFSNSDTSAYGEWTIDLSSNTDYYNYYKIECTSFTSGNAGFNNIEITATYMDWGDFISEADWQAQVASTGVCGKFVYDSVNSTVRLPKYGGQLYTSTNPVNAYYYITVKE